MILEQAKNFDPAWGELLDIDLPDSGDWAGLFRDGKELVVRTAECCIPVPAGIECSLIRSLDRERWVLVDSRTWERRENGWILSLRDNKIQSFFAGDGIQDVLASPHAIVFTYSDAGVLTPSEEGVVVFTTGGQLRAGYQSLFGAEAADISDCYAACWEDESRIVFLPYQYFPLVRWDLQKLEQHVEPTPPVLHGASAISVSGNTVFFHAPYDQKGSIFSWTPPRSRPTRVGRHPGPLRGLRGGRFLTHSTNGFTVVDVSQCAEGY